MDRRRLLAAAARAAPVLAAVPAHASAPKKSGGGPPFVKLPTLTAGIARIDGRRGVMTVEAGIDAGADADKVRAVQPRLLDAYNSSLARFAAAMRPGMAPDLDQLSREMQTATDRVWGKKGLKLLLGSVILN